MGKKSAIESLSRIIANVVVHEILLKYTNKPESISHLDYEVNEYRDTAISRAEKFNWNESEKEDIMLKALDIFKKKMIKEYVDVKFPIKEAERFLNNVLTEVCR